MAFDCRTIRESFPDLIEWVSGDEGAEVLGPSSSASPQPDTICFCQERSHLDRCLETARCVVLARPLLRHLDPDRVAATVYTSDQLQVAMARINRRFFPVRDNRQPFDGQRIHPSAVIADSATVSPTAIVGPNCVIWDNVVVGESCVIGPNTTIESHSRIGDGTHIHANVFIGHHCEIGRDCVVEPASVIGKDGYGYGTSREGSHYRKPHYGKVVLGDAVEIGSGVYIDRGTFEDAVIGEGTKIDNHCHFGHNVRIGRHCLITAGLITAGSVTIGDYCVFGGRTTVNGHLSITDGVTVAALSGVRKSVPDPGRYGGYPLLPLGTAMKNEASYVHLADMRKSLNEVRRAVGLDGEDDETPA